LINKKGNIKIIDFENICYASPEIELAYLYAQIWAVFHNDKNAVAELDGYIKSQIIPGFLNPEIYRRAKAIIVFCIFHNKSQFEPKKRKLAMAELRKLYCEAYYSICGKNISLQY